MLLKINKKIKVVPILLAGGNGTRLWPTSRVDNPKQFHNFNNYNFFKETLSVITNLKDKNIIIPEIIIVTNDVEIINGKIAITMIF